MKKAICLLVTCSLVFSLLTGCGQKKEENYVSRVTGGKLAPADVILTVNGTDIDAQHFFYWLGNSIDYAEYYYLSDGIDWESDFDGMNMEDYLMEDAIQAISQYQVVKDKAAEYGYELDETDLEELENTRQYYIDYFGSEELYLENLKSEGMDEELFHELNAVPILYNKLYTNLLAEDGPMAPAKEDFEQFLADNELIRAKHILISTQDNAGNTLSEEEVKEKRIKAEGILSTLQVSTNLDADFDALMNEHSEDSGLVYYPDGYIFGRGEMVEAFETAAYALQPGEFSGLVESQFGYHIILRMDLDAQTARADEEIYSLFTEQYFSEISEQWWSEAETERSDKLEQVDIRGFYDARAKIREEAQAELEKALASQETTVGETTEP